MKIELSKKEKKIIIIIGILIMILPLIFSRIGFINFDSNTGVIGDTIGGITAPFLSFFGSILVYLALKAQIDANDEVKKQFEKQNNDQIFFRLIDNIKDLIINYSATKSEWFQKEEVTSYKLLPYIINQLKEKVERECIFYGRQLLAKIPEQIADEYFERIIDCSLTNIEYIKKGELAFKLKNELLAKDFNDRWEHIKWELGSVGSETSEQRIVLKSIGTVYFYKTPYEMRYGIYQKAINEVNEECDGFLLPYFNSIKHLLTFVEKHKDYFYQEFINDTFTSYDKALLFYCISDNTQNSVIKTLCEKFGLIRFDELHSSFFVDSPNEIEFNRELKNIYDFDINNLKEKI